MSSRFEYINGLMLLRLCNLHGQTFETASLLGYKFVHMHGMYVGLTCIT
jgi:hypothetical protein